MDDLTPMDPEYREAPPETPQETPCYYGTGRQPEKRPSHFPIILVLICLLTLANLVTVFALLELKRTKTVQTPPAKQDDGLVAVLPSQDTQAGATVSRWSCTHPTAHSRCASCTRRSCPAL